MAEQGPTQVDMSEVKSEDIIGERMALYNNFLTGTMVTVAGTVVLLVLMALFLV
jgi:hypothetical protein